MPDTADRCLVPTPRGPLSRALLSLLTGPTDHPRTALPTLVAVADPLADDDLQLALWICYELHYRGFAGVSDEWEWHPDVLRFRGRLEHVLGDALRREVAVPPGDAPVADRLRALVAADDGPSIARHVQRRADLAQVRELMTLRSIYQLKEADPHSWAIPRLSGRAKAALVEIQSDEYGQGVTSRMHSELFRRTLTGLDLDDAYGAHVDAAPGITLAITNVISLFGLHRSRVGSLVGHLAAYEMTSSGPARRTAQGLRRLQMDDDVCRFFDEHVTADALHEQVAAHDLCGGLASAAPELTEQIMFGAAVSLHLDRRFAEHVLDAWSSGRSALRAPIPALAVAG